MSNSPMFSLYDLLPAIYKIDDEKAGGPLQAFLSVVQEQAGLLKANIGQFYADLFIETCSEWVIPYIGDLVGNRPLHSVERTQRADVARTLYYRRRKGTLPALEELARDVTGWSVRAVAFFESLVWNQNVNHLRDAGKTVDIRGLEPMDLLGSPFEQSAHTVDIRPMGSTSGWYAPRRVGFFAWRLNNYHVEVGAALREPAPNAHGFHFSPFGFRTRLFQRPEDLAEGARAGERHVPQPVRPAAFFADPAQLNDPTVTPSVHRGDGVTFGPAGNLVAMDLSGFAQPAAGEVGIDPLRGLISFAAGEIPAQAAISYRGEKPLQAEQLAGPDDHILRFPLLNLKVSHGGAQAPLARFQYMDLSAWTRPPAGRLGVDLGLGRLTFAAGEEPTTDVQYRFGESNFETAAQAAAPNDFGYLVQFPANMHSLRIARDGAPVPAFQLFCMQLDAWNRPPALRVGVDLLLGRISFPAGEEPSGGVTASYDYGFSADLGGGPYDRLAPAKPGATVSTVAANALREMKNFHLDPVNPNLADAAALELRVGLGDFNAIDDALNHWRSQGRPNCTITIQDNRTYTEDLLLDLTDKTLVLQAANRCRPAIAGEVVTNGGSGSGIVILSGLWIRSAFRAQGNLKLLVVSHCAVAPGLAEAVAIADSNQSIALTVDRTISGGVTAPANSTATLTESILRTYAAAGLANFERCTVLQDASLHETNLISECIFMDTVSVTRGQSGCIRYSYLPSASQTPRRYRCQPDLVTEDLPDPDKPAAEIRVIPVFVSQLYGDAGFAQLAPACPKEISAGGEDAGEMGAFQFLQQGRREANLRLRLDEYLPFGLGPELFT
ncbi:MAG: hypothetical protein KIT09_34450 [Bryobacteraceae bacterium]|nr:hypothetical protein [Bryobacteraceae bacterium]